MTCKDIVDLMEKLAPSKYHESWDNVGLLVGRNDKEIKKVMVALDPSEDVISQSIKCGADMLITHHPLIFSAIKRVNCNDYIGRKVYTLASNDICYYAGHTNMDIAVMADEAADMIELTESSPLSIHEGDVSCQDNNMGIGKKGTLSDALTLIELVSLVKRRFHIDNLRYVGEDDRIVKKVAICPGAGKSMIKESLNAGVEVLITGDIDHHSAVDAYDQGLLIIDAGHFDTEHFVVNYIKKYLSDNSDLEIVVAKEKSPFRFA